MSPSTETHRPRSLARSGAAGRRRHAGAVLLLVLGIVGVLFIIGMAAITSASRDTQSGRNFAAWSVALQGAQSGVEVARRRLAHPWDVNLDHGEDWPGTGGFSSLPVATDGLGSVMDEYYRVSVVSTEEEHTVTATGRAVVPGGNVNDADDVLAERTIQAVFERPKIEIPYAILSETSLTVPANVNVVGDVFSNGNLTIMPGATVSGNVYAVGTIQNFGAVTGQILGSQDPVAIPQMVYYGYRPTYDYNGIDTSALELPGSYLATGSPAGGMPGNPNNVYYKDSNYTLKTSVNCNGFTLVFKYDVIIEGTVTVKGSAKFPALLINDDLVFSANSQLTTEGMVKLRDDVLGGDAASTWTHKGPLVIERYGSINTSSAMPITVQYRVDRTSYQPVGNVVLPLPMLSYTEDP